MCSCGTAVQQRLTLHASVQTGVPGAQQSPGHGRLCATGGANVHDELQAVADAQHGDALLQAPVQQAGRQLRRVLQVHRVGAA